MKICIKCNEDKHLLKFHKDKSKKDGYRNICKLCVLEYQRDNKNRLNNYNKNFRKEFPWKAILWEITKRCENCNFKQYKDYGGRDIKCLITSKELKFLWFRDKAYLMEKPTIDRQHNNGNYELSNCRFIELNINCSKDKRMPVNQYDLSGKFIKNFESQKEASVKTEINQQDISAVINNKRKTAGGFKWQKRF